MGLLCQGRGAGVGRGRGVGVHLPAHGVVVGVAVAVGLGLLVGFDQFRRQRRASVARNGLQQLTLKIGQFRELIGAAEFRLPREDLQRIEQFLQANPE